MYIASIASHRQNGTGSRHCVCRHASVVPGNKVGRGTATHAELARRTVGDNRRPCDQVVNIGELMNEQREVINKITTRLDHHTRAIHLIIRKQRQSRKQIGLIRKFAAKRSRSIEEKFNRYDQIFDNVAGRFQELKI